MRRRYLPAAACAALVLVFMLAAALARGGQESVEAAGAEPKLVNINTADAAELQLLPGIGEVKAAAIIEYRQTYGQFSDVDALLEVPGIGEYTLEGFRAYVCVDAQEDVP